MTIRKDKRDVGKSGSYTPVKNLAFVAREYFRDCDDEIVANELEQEFGGDSFYISRSPFHLGLAKTDDNYSVLDPNETDEEREKRVYEGMDEDEGCFSDDYEHYRSLEDADVRTAEAVAHALRLQKFFRKQAEECKLAKQIDTGAGELALNEPEVVEIWQMRQICHSSGGAEGSTVRPGKNSRRPLIGDRGGDTQFDYDPAMILAEVIVNGRRYRVSRAI